MRGKFVGPFDGSVSPLRGPISGNMFLVARTRFELADGTQLLGHCQPSPNPFRPDDYKPAWLRPCILTSAGPIPLWLGGRVWKDGRGRNRGEEPTQDELAGLYALLGRAADEVFPATFAADIELPEGFVSSGHVPAFGYMRRTEFAFVT